MRELYDREAYLESAAKKHAWLKKLIEIGKKPEMKVTTTLRYANGYWGISKWLILEEALKQPGFKIDYYVIRSPQIVFEQDAPYDHPEYGVKVIAQKTIEALDTLQIPYILFDSGGKGLHTYVFFKPPESKKLLESANRKEVKPKHLRQFIFKMVCDEAKIPEEWRGVGKPQDTACHIWSDESTGHLVRICGGRKIDKEGNLKGYKTLIDRVPEVKTPVRKFSEVVYPDGSEVRVWTIPDDIFEIFLENFRKPRKRKIKGVTPQGTYLNTTCAISLRLNGAPESKRSLGAAVLAHWCLLDNLDKETALAVAEDYYEKCPKNDFDEGEVKAWFDFAYNKFYPIKNPESASGLIIKNCRHAQRLEMCNRTECELYKKMFGELEPESEIPSGSTLSKYPTQLSPWWRAPKVKWVSKKRKRLAW